MHVSYCAMFVCLFTDMTFADPMESILLVNSASFLQTKIIQIILFAGV